MPAAVEIEEVDNCGAGWNSIKKFFYFLNRLRSPAARYACDTTNDPPDSGGQYGS